MRGGYRIATSKLCAVVGGTETRRRGGRGTDADDDLMMCDWHRLELSGGILSEVPEDVRGIHSARIAVPDCIRTGARPPDTIASVVRPYGGSARACHSLWYDPHLNCNCVCVFGGFTDTLPRKAHVPLGRFERPPPAASERGGADGAPLPRESGGQRALHHLEVYDLAEGRWASAVQGGEDPIARFGCSVTDVTPGSRGARRRRGGANEYGASSESSGAYLIMGGCAGRHNHKGRHVDGAELTDAASHRVLVLERTSSAGAEIAARWRSLAPSEREGGFRFRDGGGAAPPLGRLHASCALGERSRIFFGGGRSDHFGGGLTTSSALTVLRHGLGSPISAATATATAATGEEIAREWAWQSGGGRPPRRRPSPTTGERLLSRMDALLSPDARRPGEAFLYGGWNDRELGDCWKLVVGHEREDEKERYGEPVIC